MTDAELERVRDVLARHRTDLHARYHAVGSGVGRGPGPDRPYVITIFLESAADRPSAPVTVEGIPIEFEVTGRFSTTGPQRGKPQ